jgi:hypothetical protein
MMANVNYHFAGESEHTELGEIEIDPPRGEEVAIGSRVKLTVGGNAKLGTVEAIQPSGSESACPTVILRLRRPAL